MRKVSKKDYVLLPLLQEKLHKKTYDPSAMIALTSISEKVLKATNRRCSPNKLHRRFSVLY